MESKTGGPVREVDIPLVNRKVAKRTDNTNVSSDPFQSMPTGFAFIPMTVLRS